MKKQEWIPEDLYRKILNVVPVPCIDLIIRADNRFLLGKRLNEPAKGQWFVPGGRVYKGERLQDAAIRKAKEEVGLEISPKQIGMLSTGETIFENPDRHTVNVVFTVDLSGSVEIMDFDNKQHSEFRWFSEIDESWHPYTKEILALAGFSIGS